MVVDLAVELIRGRLSHVLGRGLGVNQGGGLWQNFFFCGGQCLAANDISNKHYLPAKTTLKANLGFQRGLIPEDEMGLKIHQKGTCIAFLKMLRGNEVENYF